MKGKLRCLIVEVYSLVFWKAYNPQRDKILLKLDSSVGQKFICIFMTSITLRNPDLEGTVQSGLASGLSPSKTLMTRD